jgi:phosphoglycolate phosphatase-like HAD superfamily hydrolase
MKNKLIVFDIDGTLTNSNHVDSVLFERAILDMLPISSIDTEWNNYKYSTDAGILTEIIQSKLARNPTSNEIESIKNKFISYLDDTFTEDQSHCTPLGGAQIIFEKISRLGWDIGIATGAWEKSALLKLKCANIPYQDIPIAHSDDHIERENIISIAINRAQAIYKKHSYSMVIYVGDRLWDKAASNNLKINFIGVAIASLSIH